MQLLTPTIFIFITVACKLTTCSFPCKTSYSQGACQGQGSGTEGPNQTLKPAITANSQPGIYYCPIGEGMCCLTGPLVLSRCKRPYH
ncbi:hypothetical protein PGT21_027656 [Puccinia graminis f. sp. tritici]|uniref:CBM1 domain-containing protein n=1 Tax=Puccinia graminis f. sp. tritici TaxID=56615 RepID=A0A5B0RT87_PUCGR|nr:hypothetical protein PGT21_027656 [Puccinia graminis f. sp. tritici]KAA1128083.1 hypothetical protein PGTUg99_004627 [Puccinia graminis f. sp. tritici]